MINEDKLNEAYGKMVVSEKEFFKRSEVEQTVNPEYYEDAMAGIDIELGDMMDWMYDVAITFAPTKDLDKIKMDMVSIMKYINSHKELYTKKDLENYEYSYSKFTNMSKKANDLIAKQRKLMDKLDASIQNKMKSIRSKYVKEGLENYNSQLEIEDILKKNMNKIISVGFIIPINDVRYVVKSYNYGKTFTITKYGDKKVSYESINIRLLSNWLEKRQYNN